MAGSDATKLGDYCKWLESDGTGKVCGRTTGIMARMDGRAFHSFTRGLDKPYDEHLIAMMSDTAAKLVDEFNPTLAYWQSDEITLYWSIDPTTTREHPFGGKAHKLTSVLAAQTTAFFLKSCLELMPKKFDELPHFDARVFSVASARDAFLPQGSNP